LRGGYGKHYIHHLIAPNDEMLVELHDKSMLLQTRRKPDDAPVPRPVQNSGEISAANRRRDLPG